MYSSLHEVLVRPEFFYLLIYGIFFSDLGSGGGGGDEKKRLVIFRAFFSFAFFLQISPE